MGILPQIRSPPLHNAKEMPGEPQLNKSKARRRRPQTQTAKQCRQAEVGKTTLLQTWKRGAVLNNPPGWGRGIRAMQGKQQGPQRLLLGRNNKAHLQQEVSVMALSAASSSGSTSGCSPPCIFLYLGCCYCLRGHVLSPSKLIQVKKQSFKKNAKKTLFPLHLTVH